MHPLNITESAKARGAALMPGESIWRTEQGNCFKLFIIHDEVASHNGNVVWRYQGCWCDEAGSELPMPNGGSSWDPHPHHHILVAGARHTPEEALMAGVEVYLGNLDKARADAHQTLAQHATGLTVPSSQAHRIPENLNHLRRTSP
jgi:hypothetical protein